MRPCIYLSGYWYVHAWVLHQAPMVDLAGDGSSGVSGPPHHVGFSRCESWLLQHSQRF